MEERPQAEGPESPLGDKPQPANRPLRGLYSRVNISVRTLNLIIIVLCAALAVCMAIGISNRGFQVTFDAQGGTTVAPQTRMYGELLVPPEDPTREGYVFDGWYLDPGATTLWRMEEDTVQQALTLYAGWRPADQPPVGG